MYLLAKPNTPYTSMWWFQEGTIVGGIEIRGISKSKGTSTMRKVGLLVVESCKAEGKLSVTFKTIQIK
jgi:hypothetical protein